MPLQTLGVNDAPPQLPPHHQYMPLTFHRIVSHTHLHQVVKFVLSLQSVNVNTVLLPSYPSLERSPLQSYFIPSCTFYKIGDRRREIDSLNRIPIERFS